MNETKLQKINNKITVPLNKVLSLSIFDEPRPKYLAKVTVIDKFFATTFLKLFPRSVRPNFLTVFRFVSIPFVALLLINGDYVNGLWLFALSAFSDALDGALARTRNQITDWGIVFDPVADKLLIGTTAVIVISKVVSPYLAGILIFFEVVLIVSAYFRLQGQLIPAITVGKIKMILQSVGVGLLLFALVFESNLLVAIATNTLYLSIIFAALESILYKAPK